ncbi:hypothetical protein ACLOJK_018613 [Asimina triloba]
MGRRASRATTLEEEATHTAKALLWDLYAAQLEQERLKAEAIDLLSNLAAAQVERDEAVNDVEAVRVEASRLFAELIAFRSGAEALRARGIDPYVSGVEPCTKLETVKGETSLLHE